jgi:hypothetical protein
MSLSKKKDGAASRERREESRFIRMVRAVFEVESSKPLNMSRLEKSLDV